MTKKETKNSDVVEALDEPVKPRKSKSKTNSWAPLLVFVAFLVGMLVMTLVQAQRPQNLESDASTPARGAQALQKCVTRKYKEINDKGCIGYLGSDEEVIQPIVGGLKSQKCTEVKDSSNTVTHYTRITCTPITDGGGGSGGGAEPEPAPPTDYGDRCQVKGRVEYFDNLNLRNASKVIRWTSIGDESISTNAEGVYNINKRYSNVGDTFELKVNNPYLTYRTFEVKGAVPSGCSVINGGTTIKCAKSVCFNRNESLISFNFEEKAPAQPTQPPQSKPNAKITNVSNLTSGQTLAWTVEATDVDNNLQSSGLYLHRGTPVAGETQGWTVLKWVGGQQTSSMTYRHNDAAGVRTQFVCDASKAGTWTVFTNAVDTTGLNCSGNSVVGATRCASYPNDVKTFTCTVNRYTTTR